MPLSKEIYTMLDLCGLEEKVVCLTLDVEHDYGTLVEQPSYEGVDRIPDFVEFIRERNIPLTCFVQGSLFQTHPSEVEKLATLDVEFELHSFSHAKAKDANVKAEIERGKQAYLSFFRKEPMGYRFPDGVIAGEGYDILAANGFKFDSSVFPSLRPGSFNNLRAPTKPYLLNESQIVEFPFTVFSSVVRIPVALSYIKLLGRPYIRLLKTFDLPRLIVFDFHLHDLFRLDAADKIPLRRWSLIYRLAVRRIYRKNRDGLVIFDELVTILREKGYSFQKLIDVYEAISK